MILVDTSVWVDHLRRSENGLVALLRDGEVLLHPFIIGELACGNLRNRAGILGLMQGFEVMRVIESNALMGRGIGYVDVHLLASTLSHDNARLWTRDKRLAACADELNLLWRE